GLHDARRKAAEGPLRRPRSPRDDCRPRNRGRRREGRNRSGDRRRGAAAARGAARGEEAARCSRLPGGPPCAAGDMPGRRLTPVPDARAVAHDVLVRVETTAAFADVLLSRRIAMLPPADRALATELVYGTLAWQGRLDHHLRAL